MKDFRKSHDRAGQSPVIKKPHKHDANLQKNSSLYFQIGLILCLLTTYMVFEMKFENKSFELESYAELLPEDDTYQMVNIIVEPDAPKQEQVQKKKVIITNTFDIKDDDTKIDDTDAPEIFTEPQPTSDPVDPSVFDDVDKPPVEPKIEIFDMRNVEIVPVYPGCEKKKTNADRVKCMNEKLGRLIQRKFDTDLASELGLYGKQRINVQFKINQNGEITEILTRAPHPSLEKEAKRVANKIPQMKPGLQRQKPVSVVYNLPIVFNVNQ